VIRSARRNGYTDEPRVAPRLAGAANPDRGGKADGAADGWTIAAGIPLNPFLRSGGLA
jgi:hypothetical protein